MSLLCEKLFITSYIYDVSHIHIMCVILGMHQSCELIQIFFNLTSLKYALIYIIFPATILKFIFSIIHLTVLLILQYILLSVRDYYSERLTQIISQQSYSTSDEVANDVVQVKTIDGLVESMHVSKLSCAVLIQPVFNVISCYNNIFYNE